MSRDPYEGNVRVDCGDSRENELNSLSERIVREDTNHYCNLHWCINTFTIIFFGALWCASIQPIRRIVFQIYYPIISFNWNFLSLYCHCVFLLFTCDLFPVLIIEFVCLSILIWIASYYVSVHQNVELTAADMLDISENILSINTISFSPFIELVVIPIKISNNICLNFCQFIFKCPRTVDILIFCGFISWGGEGARKIHNEFGVFEAAVEVCFNLCVRGGRIWFSIMVHN